MRRHDYPRFLSCAALAAAGVAYGGSAFAVNPLEYPDNGANQFSRGGAWLATATDPIAAFYNPAALATISSSASVDVRLNYQTTCFERTDENGEPAAFYANSSSTAPYAIYREACNAREAFPLTIPAIAAAWRAADRLGIGFAVVPPAAYGTADEGFPAVAPAVDPETGERLIVPAPYRYMTMGNQSTILFPTASVGYELFKNFRVGAGFVAGMAIINVFTGGQSRVAPERTYDVGSEDSFSNLRVEDLFVPGAVASIHWSVAPQWDLALWGRWSDAIRAHEGDLTVNTLYFDENVGFAAPATRCPEEPPGTGASCSGSLPNTAQTLGPDVVDEFKFAYPPPEVRAGVRFHQPRSGAVIIPGAGNAVRDPLHDDVFDIELDGSYTWNSVADVTVVRFTYDPAKGAGPQLNPVGSLPPIADVPTGFKDSWGLRLGGQYNVAQDKVGIMAGAWYESESQKPELLNVSQPGPERGGFGGGLIFRQDFIDFTFGYQYHWSSGLETSDGLRRAPTGATTDPSRPQGWDVNNPDDPPPSCQTAECAVDRQEFRTYHIVNNGTLTQHAHAFALGAVMRF